MNQDIRKLTQIKNVNRRRAERLVDKFGSYDAVMEASYQQLLNTHYIGEVTAKSIRGESGSDPSGLL